MSEQFEYKYKSPDGDLLRLEERGEYVAVDSIDVADNSRVRVVVLASERQAAAQALAGDEYRVVPNVGPTRGGVMESLGVRSVDDILPAIERLQQTASMPTWERQLLAGQAAQEEIEQLKRDYDALEKRLREAERHPDIRERCPACNHEPDRPEPVDPASVRVGQVVEIEADDGSWMVRGEVAATTEHDPGRPISIGVPFSFGALWPNVTNATVRVLQAAEPEPDEAAVEALAQALYAAKAERIGLERDWSEIGNQDRLRHRTEALTLTRDHGVEVPTDD